MYERCLYMIDDYIKKWLIKALEDFKVAKHELDLPDNEIATGAVCFHCQQFVEKFLKAYLISKKIDFGKIHDLKFLLELCSQQDSDFKKLNVGNLTFYAVEARYPDEFYIPTVDEARVCFRIALNVKGFVSKKLGISEMDIGKK